MLGSRCGGHGHERIVLALGQGLIFINGRNGGLETGGLSSASNDTRMS